MSDQTPKPKTKATQRKKEAMAESVPIPGPSPKDHFNSDDYQAELTDLKQKMEEHSQTLAELKGIPAMMERIMKRLDSEDVNDDFGSNHEGVEEENFDSVSDLIANGNPESADDNELNSLLPDDEDEVEGPPVAALLLDKIKKYTSDTLTKENLEKFKARTLTPSNCSSLFNAQRMNPEIWGLLPTAAKSNDVKAQCTQTLISKSQSCFASIANELVTACATVPKDIREKILRLSMDGLAFLASAQRNLGLKRKQNVKNHLDPQYANICTTIPDQGSKMLFGDNLMEKLKESKSVSSLMKQAGGSRLHTYRGKSLNYWGRPRFPSGAFRTQVNRGRPGFQRTNYRFQRPPPKQ